MTLLPRKRAANGSNVTTEFDDTKHDMADANDVQTEIYEGWEPQNAGGGSTGDSVTAHPAYTRPTRYQGTTLDEMGF